jgi:hypothetical protein
MLFASTESVAFALSAAGGLATQLPIPNSMGLPGTTFYEQVVAAQLDALGAITAITSSNALQLTIGSL